MISSVKFLGSVLRSKDGFALNQRWIEYCLIPAIEEGVNIKVPLMPREELSHIHRVVYESNGIALEDIEASSWVDLYTKEPSKDVQEVLKRYFENTLVIAFELHPLIQKSFDILGITYIKLMNHPVRYMSDIFFGMTSNNENIHKKMLKYQTDEFIFKQHAGILQAEHSVNDIAKRISIKENSCIFFGQTNVDCSLIDGNRILNFFDFKDEFLRDIAPYDHVYFKVHPYGKNEDVLEFVNSIEKISILKPHDINFYDLISSENIKECFAISSGALYEARLFGKKVKYYHKQPFFFVSDYQDGNYDIKETFIPIYKTFWQPYFWGEILDEFFDKNTSVKNHNEFYPNKLRRILKLNWGYYDSDSVEQYYKNKDLMRHIKYRFNEIRRLERSLIMKLNNFIVKLIYPLIPIKSVRHAFKEKYFIG